MYTLLRKIHLYSGLILLLFVFLYFASGYVMIHPGWFGQSEPVITEREAALDDRGFTDEQALSRSVQRQFGLRGKRLPPGRLDEGGWRLRYHRPGTSYRAEVAEDRRTVRITEEKRGWQSVVIGLHRLHGYGGGALYALWALLFDLVSLSMIVFAFTGIYLWYKLTKKRRLGWILLAATWAYALGTIGYLMLAP